MEDDDNNHIKILVTKLNDTKNEETSLIKDDHYTSSANADKDLEK
ncbi:12101_t:CDS:2 [Entrophospora sp. SA101]|nr:12101_t:CDS:2 [Entrophospora sp. SA101]